MHVVQEKILEAGSYKVTVAEPAPGVMYTCAEGRLEVGAVHALIAFYAEMTSRRVPVTVFHDWEHMLSYTPESRKVYVDWSATQLHTVDRVHILVGSRLVAMGVSVASLVLPYLVSYPSRTAFENERLATIARRRRSGA